MARSGRLDGAARVARRVSGTVTTSADMAASSTLLAAGLGRDAAAAVRLLEERLVAGELQAREAMGEGGRAVPRRS